MQHVTRPARRRVLGRLLAVIGIAVAAIGITTLPASAHHPLISGQADCNGTVKYTSTAWSNSNPAARTNGSVLIQVKVGSTWKQVGNGVYNSSNNFSFGGTFTQPTNAFPFQLRAVAAGTWGDKAAGGQTTETTVGAPSGCSTTPPVVSKPKASVAHSCTGYTAKLDNSASTTSVVFTVSVNGTTAVTQTVAKGASATVTKTLPPGKYTVTVSSGSTSLASTGSYDTTSCGSTSGTPKATVTVDCSGYTVTVVNAGGGSTKLPFVVTVNGQPQSVSADSSGQSVTGKVTSGVNHFSVTQNGTTLVEKTFDASTCSSTSPPVGTPKAQISVDCNGFVTTLDNTGSTAPTTYVVTTAAGTANAVQHSETVTAGHAASFTWPVQKGVAQTVTVSAPGLTTVTKTFSGDCAVVSPPTSSSPSPTPTPSAGSTPTTSVSAPSTSGTTSSTGSSGTGSSGTTASGSSSAGSTSSGSSLPKTGNTVSPLVLGLGILLALVGGGLLLVDRTRRRRA